MNKIFTYDFFDRNDPSAKVIYHFIAEQQDDSDEFVVTILQMPSFMNYPNLKVKGTMFAFKGLSLEDVNVMPSKRGGWDFSDKAQNLKDSFDQMQLATFAVRNFNHEFDKFCNELFLEDDDDYYRNEENEEVAKNEEANRQEDIDFINKNVIFGNEKGLDEFNQKVQNFVNNIKKTLDENNAKRAYQTRDLNPNPFCEEDCDCENVQDCADHQNEKLKQSFKREDLDGDFVNLLKDVFKL